MGALIKCLEIAKLIDNNKNWIGKDTVVVQVGDQIDSCNRSLNVEQCNYEKVNNEVPNDISILYFMTELHKKASFHGGAIYSLIGNHEMMNVMGDMSYVSHANLLLHSNNKDIEEGKQERIKLFTPGNTIAQFLACTRRIALVIGDILFVHGELYQLLHKNME